MPDPHVWEGLKEARPEEVKLDLCFEGWRCKGVWMRGKIAEVRPSKPIAL